MNTNSDRNPELDVESKEALLLGEGRASSVASSLTTETPD